MAPELPSAWLTPSEAWPAVRDSSYFTPSRASDTQQSLKALPAFAGSIFFPSQVLSSVGPLTSHPGMEPASRRPCTNTGTSTLLSRSRFHPLSLVSWRVSHGCTDLGYVTPALALPSPPALSSWGDAGTIAPDVPKVSCCGTTSAPICGAPDTPFCRCCGTHKTPEPCADLRPCALQTEASRPVRSDESLTLIMGVPVQSCPVLSLSHFTFCEKRSFHFLPTVSFPLNLDSVLS